MQTLVSQSEYSRHRKVNPGTVNIWKNQGKIPIINGKIPLEEADRLLEERANLRKDRSNNNVIEELKYLADTGLNYAQARGLHEQYKAGKAKLELDETTGKLISVKDVEKQAYKLARTVRDTMQAIPERLASILAEESDEFTVHEILTKEINECLQAIGSK